MAAATLVKTKERNCPQYSQDPAYRAAAGKLQELRGQLAEVEQGIREREQLGSTDGGRAERVRRLLNGQPAEEGTAEAMPQLFRRRDDLKAAAEAQEGIVQQAMRDFASRVGREQRPRHRELLEMFGEKLGEAAAAFRELQEFRGLIARNAGSCAGLYALDPTAFPGLHRFFL